MRQYVERPSPSSNELPGAPVNVSINCTIRAVLTYETREVALARLGRALADPTRCRILLALLDGASYPGQLAAQLGLSRSNVSNHLSCLRGCGLVIATYQGRQVHYALADAHLATALRELVKVVLAPSSSSALAVDQARACIDDQAAEASAR